MFTLCSLFLLHVLQQYVSPSDHYYIITFVCLKLQLQFLMHMDITERYFKWKKYTYIFVLSGDCLFLSSSPVGFSKKVFLFRKKRYLDSKCNICSVYMCLLFQVANAKMVRFSVEKQSRSYLCLFWQKMCSVAIILAVTEIMATC